MGPEVVCTASDRERPDLRALAVEPQRAADLPDDDVLRLLALLIAELGRRAAVQGALAARAQVPDPPDEWLDVRQAAAFLGRSISWVQKCGPRLPGYRQ